MLYSRKAVLGSNPSLSATFRTSRSATAFEWLGATAGLDGALSGHHGDGAAQPGRLSEPPVTGEKRAT